MASTLNFFVKELRSLGFFHVTGLPTPSKMGRVAFPRDFWGKFASDNLTTIMVILDNGEIWMKYSHSVDNTDIEWLREQMGDSTFQYSESQGEPYFFGMSGFISNLLTDIFVVRVADPYFDFHGACNPDPSSYLSEFHS